MCCQSLSTHPSDHWGALSISQSDLRLLNIVISCAIRRSTRVVVTIYSNMLCNYSKMATRSLTQILFHRSFLPHISIRYNLIQNIRYTLGAHELSIGRKESQYKHKKVAAAVRCGWSSRVHSHLSIRVWRGRGGWMMACGIRSGCMHYRISWIVWI
jgi:hypothetical protein